MPKRPFQLDRETVVLPRGTRVVLRTDVRGEDGYLHKQAAVAVVKEVSNHSYALETPSGRKLTAQRDQIALQRQDLLEDLGNRQWEFRRLIDRVIYAAVVGSRAWSLSDEHSDEDVRGCFVLPFEDHSGLWDAPDEIQHATGDAAYWEVSKLVAQGLRGDANTLETLWSPLVQRTSELGDRLVRERRMFVSMNILGSFGRYAQSQFKKMERSLRRDAAVEGLLAAIERGEIDDLPGAARSLFTSGVASSEAQAKEEAKGVCRSLFDRGLVETVEFSGVVDAIRGGRRSELVPRTYRPKNAYNLLRLLHSCVSWLTTGEPLIAVRGDLRQRLLDIKELRVPVESVIDEARLLADALDDLAQSSLLPERPDYEAADEFLKACRRDAARRTFGISTATLKDPNSNSGEAWSVEMFPAALPPDIDVPALERFFDAHMSASLQGKAIWVALTGSHTYGFPSPDSDLDLKGVHVLPAHSLLGLTRPELSYDYLGDWEGREYDLTLNEVANAASLILSGNGNMLERFLGPMPVMVTPLGMELKRLTKQSLSKRAYNHYRGFLKGMIRELERQRDSSSPSAKTALYAYRVALTGRHLLLTGELQTHVGRLAEEYGIHRVPELVAVKQSSEHELLPRSALAAIDADLEELARSLDDALVASPLPDEPPTTTQLDDFVVRVRMLLGTTLKV
ncbi:MAG: nucleotidyltransferase domain-containing protein [Myxococcota bacterium]